MKQQTPRYFNKAIISIERFFPLLNKVLHLFILISILVLCLETFKEFDQYKSSFIFFETFSAIIFSIEYLIRVLWAINERKGLKYVLSPMGIIDLLSITPTYLPMISVFHLTVFKTLRLFRLLRIFKLYRYSDHLQTVIEVIKHKLEYLGALFFATSIVVVFCSCATYYFEHDLQPTIFVNIFSSLWWAVSTVMTIGYGDIVPITAGGKVMATLLGFLGISLLAVLAGIFSAGFVEVVDRKKMGMYSPKDNLKIKED